MDAVASQFLTLLEIMETLRGPEGCPWDREQTAKSIRPYCLEEAYEVVDAIDQEDDESLREELGDLLLQIVFHSQLAKEEGKFHVGDVISSISEKMIRRHPHVFGSEEERVETSKEVLQNWAQIKKVEGRKNVLDGIPKALPALLRATRMGEKAATVGFDWKRQGEVWKKVREEISEIEAAGENLDQFEEEIGDLLFTLASVCRHRKIDAETALRRSTEKFERRFRWMEQESKNGKALSDCTAQELDELWEKAKASMAHSES